MAARKESDEVADGAAASKQHNTHSDEMARVGHLLSYPGATSLITKTRSSMDRMNLDATHLGSESARNEANPYYQLVMDYFNDFDPASDFNLTCYNPVSDFDGQPLPDNIESRGLYSNIRSQVKDIDPSCFSENLNKRDADWLKKSIAKFMSTTGNVADKYSRSGNYDAECEYLEWGNFSSGCASWVYYSVLIFAPQVMKQWLPQLPPDEVRDTGIRGMGNKKDLTAKDRMKKYRKRKSDDGERDEEAVNNISRSNNSPESDLSNSFIIAANQESELRTLDILYNGKDAKLAKKAGKELAKRIKWTVKSDDETDSE